MPAYISFDMVPAPKGAATHIEAFAKTLGARLGRVDLVTPTNAPTPIAAFERWPGVFHTELPALGPSLIDRVLCFRRFLQFWLERNRCDVIQFRSIFEGFPLLRLSPRPRLIFEVNALPSIELKYRYPKSADDRELMGKIAGQERACLDAADRIVTPSAVTARFLRREAKTVVIPNGVDLGEFTASDGRPDHVNLIYFGTLSAWQGVELAVRAVEQLATIVPARLTILGVGNARQNAALAGLVSKLHLDDLVEVLPPVDRRDVAARLRQSFAVLAPLPVNDRNSRQGCCPLKILEGMAAGVPVIASDLPVVRDLGEHGKHLLLVKPGSVDQIANAVLELYRDPELWARLANGGRAHVEGKYTWDHAGAALAGVWSELLASSRNNGPGAGV